MLAGGVASGLLRFSTDPGKPHDFQGVHLTDHQHVGVPQFGASDLHVQADGPFIVRVSGKLQPLGETCSTADLQQMGEELLVAGSLLALWRFLAYRRDLHPALQYLLLKAATAIHSARRTRHRAA